MPHGFDKLLHHEPESSPPTPPRRKSTLPRYHLHVRQQPIAARACGAGDRDRRPVDPPPIVQILLSDFDPESEDDKDTLQDPRFTVGCLLFSFLGLIFLDPTPGSRTSRTRSRERKNPTASLAQMTISLPLSSLEKHSCPHSTSKPIQIPILHPLTPLHDINPPPSSQPHNLRNASKLHQPATFFIFADLSIRTAGLYGLQFRLMNWGSVEDTGQSMPILAEAWSDPFRVYAAKDFPGCATRQFWQRA
ncbi:Velvet factor [Penicillium tannophilum]|nr:Velvet factor [Penicillium tannophilum]